MSSKWAEIYYRDLAYGKEAEARRKKSKIIARGKDAEMGLHKMGKGSYLVDPSLGFNTSTLQMFIAEIPPGKHTGKHRHLIDAAIYILSGAGHSIVEDERYDWEAGDAVFVPPWSWHQHFNPSKTTPVRYLAVVTIPLMQGLGVFRMEQVDDQNY